MSEPYAFIEGRFGRIGLVEMDTALAVHVHHHVHLIAKAGGADTLFRVRDREHPVTDERAVLVDAWEPHAWEPHAWEPHAAGRSRPVLPTLFLTFYLEPDWVRHRLGLAPGEALRLFAEPGVPIDASARRALRCLADILSRMTFRPERFPGGARPGGMGDAGDGLDDLIGSLLGAVVAPRSSRVAAASESRRPHDHRIRRAFALLRSGELQGLDGIAREVGLSRPRFFELFRDCTGLTPRNVANAARMEHAIDRLSHSGDPLGRMALDLGYASQGNFSRFFKQQIGICPNSYRRAARRVDGRHPA